MKNIKLITFLCFSVFLITISVVGFVSPARAQLATQALPQETIVSYSSDITVNVDNSIGVVETIVYNTGPQAHHGIYRDIDLLSSQQRTMGIEDIAVADENGRPYPFQTSDLGGSTRIKIGDPSQTFVGQKIYVIRYRATRAVAQLKDVDEIYWNVTGNGWSMPIERANATVTLPAGTTAVQSACYYGPKDSTNQCEDSPSSFSAPTSLNPYEGLTVAVGFPKGVVAPYSAADNAASFFDAYLPWIIAALLPILTLILSLWYWYKKGRDPRGTGMIIPQYDVPDGLTPMEVGGIANEKVGVDYISAEIIYLATKGYLKINQLEERFIGLIKTTDYELVRLKDSADLPNEFDRQLMDALFAAPVQMKVFGFSVRVRGSRLAKMAKDAAAGAGTAAAAPSQESVKLSDLKNDFYQDAAVIRTTVLDSLLNEGYYKNLGRMKNSGSRIVLVLFMAFWASGFFGGAIGALILRGNPIPVMIGIFLSILIYGIVSYFNPAKTEKGVATKEYILGLKEYLRIAEKDRLEFHNAPEKKPEVFEKLLPFAMVLGVSDIWAKEFEGIYTVPPSWYSGPMGPGGSAFSAIAFSHSMTHFSSFATSSLGSAPGGGGSGGGGSSGGGGGGGGGGGW